MIGSGMGAGNKSVQPLDLVCEAVGHKELQRTIGNRGLRPEARVAQPVKHLVSTKCAMFLQQDLKRLVPDWCEAKPVACAMRLGRRHCGIDTVRMVVLVEPDCV